MNTQQVVAAALTVAAVSRIYRVTPRLVPTGGCAGSFPRTARKLGALVACGRQHRPSRLDTSVEEQAASHGEISP